MNSKTNKGITLIALVITIIVLLILAGVTINMVLGDDGIIKQAQQAKKLNKDAAIQEEINLIRAEVKMAENGLGDRAELPDTAQEVITRLEGKKLVDSDELKKNDFNTLGYRDSNNTKTFKLDGIVEHWQTLEEYRASEGENKLFEIDDNGVFKQCLAYPGADGFDAVEDYCIDVVIPYGVTTIGENAFGNCDLLSVSIPDTVTEIKAGAFSNSTAIGNLYIPDSVTEIADDAFCYSAITSINIPKSVTKIADSMFADCYVLNTITLHDSITEIGSDAFVGCNELENITIPSSVTQIGDGAFYNCSRLETITIPDSVTTLGSYAFYNCSSLSSATIGNSVTTIGESTFEGSGLTSITLGNKITSIGDRAFYGSSLDEITIPDTVTSIGNSAFYQNYSLNSVKIGKNSKLTTIGYNAFYDTSLDTFWVPPTVTSIGSEAFGYTDNVIVTFGSGSAFIEETDREALAYDWGIYDMDTGDGDTTRLIFEDEL